MKARVYLSVGALLLFLAPLGCSDKAESPAPETPPEEQPVQPSERRSRNQKSRSSWMRICRWKN